MSIKVPSLSAAGWLSEISEKADALMAYYLTSEKSQSYLYSGKVTSLTHHVQEFGQDPSRLEERIKTDLGTYLRRYFQEVEIEVRTDLPDVNDPNRINLTLGVIVMDDGYRYSLGREIRSENNRITNIFTINNEGG